VVEPGAGRNGMLARRACQFNIHPKSKRLYFKHCRFYQKDKSSVQVQILFASSNCLFFWSLARRSRNSLTVSEVPLSPWVSLKPPIKTRQQKSLHFTLTFLTGTKILTGPFFPHYPIAVITSYINKYTIRIIAIRISNIRTGIIIIC
jgi:hypothetical protein